MSNGLTIQLHGCGQSEACFPSSRRKFGLAHVSLLTLALGVAHAASSNSNTPPPIPLPQAKVTVPILSHVVENGVVKATELQQVQALESPGLMPVLFILGDPNKSAPSEWSLITTAHVRVFRLDNRIADVSTTSPAAMGTKTSSMP